MGSFMSERAARLHKKQNGIDLEAKQRNTLFAVEQKKIFSLCLEFLIRSNNSCHCKRLKEVVP